MNLKILILLLAIFSTTTISGQEALGLRLQRFSGINSTLLNPALGALYPKKWDVNLGETVNSISNNYFFLENSKAGEINRYQNSQHIYSRPDLINDQPLESSDLVVDFNTRTSPFYGDVLANVLGPSFLIHFGQHSLGLTTRARVETETVFASDLGYYTYVKNKGAVNMTASHFSAMAWREWGLNYAYSIDVSDYSRLALGFNLRYLQGYEGVMASNKPFTYKHIRTDSFEVSRGKSNLAYTTGNLGVDANNPYQAKIQGTGLGIDLGLVYESIGERWNWTLGFALNDLGKIRFKNSGALHQFKNDSLLLFDTDPYVDWKNASDVSTKAALLSELLNGNPQASLVDSSFAIGLPANLVLHTGLYQEEGWRMFAVWQQSLAFKPDQLHKGSTLSVAGGWENNWLAAYVPVTLYRWQRLRVGAALRLAFLTIGTDNLIPWISRGKLSEAGFYAAIKISPWPKNMSNGEKPGKGKKKRGRGLDCYQF